MIEDNDALLSLNGLQCLSQSRNLGLLNNHALNSLQALSNFNSVVTLTIKGNNVRRRPQLLTIFMKRKTFVVSFTYPLRQYESVINVEAMSLAHAKHGSQPTYTVVHRLCALSKNVFRLSSGDSLHSASITT